MSFIHVNQGNAGLYSAVIHTPTPSGSNAVGIAWKACILSIPRTSTLPIGTEVGQITSSEAAQIVAGDVLEYQFGIQMRADGSTPSPAEITMKANQVVVDENSRNAVVYKYFGYTQ